MPASTVKMFGQASYPLRGRGTELFVTRLGGEMAPVRFDLGPAGVVEPFSVAPWWNEKYAKPSSGLPAIVRVLRGDFFCMPFGDNATPFRAAPDRPPELHPLHGQTANQTWRKVSLGTDGPRHTLALRMKTTIRPATVDKQLTVIDGQTVVYQCHTVTGMSGPMSYGHHATLRFPSEQEGGGVVSLSPIAWGQVYPGLFEDPARGGYGSLKPGSPIRSLEKVERATGGTTDLSRYPARRGFEDIALVAADPKLSLAWSAVVFPGKGYVWYSVRPRAKLPLTVLWISNAGRHYAPWDGRHERVMGIEDVCSYYGLAASVAPNPASRAGFATHHRFDPDTPHRVPYAFGAAAIPTARRRRFDKVKSIELDRRRGADRLVLTAHAGARIAVAFDPGLLGM